MREAMTTVLSVLAVGLVALGLLTGIWVVILAGLAGGLTAWARRHWRVGDGRRMALSAISWVLAVSGALLCAGLGLLWWRSAPPTPDAFYEPPGNLPPSPGRLVRQEDFARAVPPGARAWRILYTTTRDEQVGAVASAIVLAPASLPAGPSPVVAWTHGTTGIATGCAPSVLPLPFPFDQTVPAVPQLITEGWVLVGTDYVGLGTHGPHPYLVGQGEARSALDAIRAARQIEGLALADETVVWGHSQGGHAALWTGALAPSYAPDVRIAGVAALAPATDLPALVEAAQGSPVGKMMASYVTTSYSQVYGDVRVDEYVGPTRRARGMANRCLSGPGALLSVAVAATLERPVFIASPARGALGARLQANTPHGFVEAPLLIAQGRSDDLVLPAIQDRFVEERCAAGQALEYRTYEGRDHVSLVAQDSPLTDDLVRWTRARFAGEPVPAECRTLQR